MKRPTEAWPIHDMHGEPGGRLDRQRQKLLRHPAHSVARRLPWWRHTHTCQPLRT